MSASAFGFVARRILVLATVATLVVACGADGGGAVVTMAPSSIGPARTVSPAVALTRAELVRALGERNLVLDDTQRPVRPPEAEALTTAPRAVYQVILPEDPDEGFIVVYEFGDPAAAVAAAAAEAGYLGSGPGRVQGGPDGTVHVIRQVGSTVVLYTWHPEGAVDPRAPDIQAALETLGVEVPVPG